jgi:Alpha-L-arabinofuranosidase C-terminal domain
MSPRPRPVPHPRRSAAAALLLVAALAAHYPFEEGSGTTTADVSGTGKPDGTLGSGVTWNSSGAMGRSLTFAGASPAAVTIPGQVVDTSQSFTVSAWVRITTTNSYDTAVCISGGAVCNFYLQVLSGPDPNAGNTLADPDRITPKSGSLHGSDGTFAYAAPPNSLTVVTVKGPHG